MYRFLSTLRARATNRVLAGTTFCEACSQVCPPGCRGEALLDRHRANAQRAGLYHL
jgi:hypothetical protein